MTLSQRHPCLCKELLWPRSMVFWQLHLSFFWLGKLRHLLYSPCSLKPSLTAFCSGHPKLCPYPFCHYTKELRTFFCHPMRSTVLGYWCESGPCPMNATAKQTDRHLSVLVRGHHPGSATWEHLVLSIMSTLQNRFSIPYWVQGN